jgi:hypothetical protein
MLFAYIDQVAGPVTFSSCADRHTIGATEVAG